MTENNKDRRMVPGQADPGFIKNISMQVRLILRLIADSRVNFLLKLLPIGSLAYLLAPDLLPVNPIDDAVVLGVGVYMFVELCPPDVVEEHRRALWGEEKGEAVDAEFKEEDEKNKGG